MKPVVGLRRGASSALALVLATAGWTGASPARAQEAVLPAESYMVVDCLLPGQVRKLGRTTTFLTPRRPIRTSGVNCEIRGGEYVAVDRADFTSSLAVWLPSAQQGDAKAQAYVGRIYADGLGRTPDYEQAAIWYQKASDHGYAQAMIDLGQLYERGLGVPKDPLKAVSLYRQASGLPASNFADAGSVAAAASSSPAKTAAQDPGAQAMARELDAARQQLAQERAALAETRARLERASTMPRPATPSAQTSPDVARMQLVLAEKAAQLDASNARSAQLSADLAKAKAAAEQRTAPLVAQLRSVQSDRTQVLQQRDDAQQELATLRAQLPDQKGRRDALEAQAAQSRKLADQANAKLAATLASLQAREQELANTKSRLAQQQADAANRSGDQEAAARLHAAQASYAAMARDLDQTRADAVAQKTEISAAQRALQTQEANLALARAATSAAEARLASAQSDLNARDARLKADEAKLSEAQLQVAAARAAMARQIDPLEQRLRDLQAAASGLQAERDRALQTINGLTTQVADLKQQVAQARQSGAAASQDLSAREAKLAAREAKVQDLETKLASALVSYRNAPGPKITEPSARPVRLAASSQFGFTGAYAVLIGESHYKDARFQTLATPGNDATQLGEILQNRYGFKVTVMLDKSRAEILHQLDQLSEKLTESDTLVIYYAGHGGMERVRSNGDQRGYWLPVDAEAGGSASEISNQEITYQVARMAARKVLIIADSCYSGLLTRTVGRAQRPVDAEEKSNDYLIGMAHKQSRNVLTSGGLEPVLDGGGAKNHSVFAAALIDVLRTNNDVITSEEIYSRLVTKVMSTATSVLLRDRDTPDPQQPQYSALDNGGHIYGDFLFVPKSAAVAVGPPKLAGG